MEVRVINPSASELYHHGVKGQKWGIHRYQNKDGSLTAEGKAKLQKFKKTEKADIKKRLDAKKSKINEKLAVEEDVNKRKELRSKKSKAIKNAKAEIDVIKDYTLNDIRKERLAVGAEVTAKTLAAIGFFVVPMAPDIAGLALIASSKGAKQHYRLRGV